MCNLLGAWLQAHEFLAVWLEGIALVAIFVWDRLDNRNQHDQTIGQLQLSRKQIEASREQVESLYRPCLTLSAATRHVDEAAARIGGSIGIQVPIFVLCVHGTEQLADHLMGVGRVLGGHLRDSIVEQTSSFEDVGVLGEEAEDEPRHFGNKETTLSRNAPTDLTFPPLSSPGALQRFHFGSTRQSVQNPKSESRSSWTLAPMAFSGTTMIACLIP